MGWRGGIFNWLAIVYKRALKHVLMLGMHMKVLGIVLPPADAQVWTYLYGKKEKNLLVLSGFVKC